MAEPRLYKLNAGDRFSVDFDTFISNRQLLEGRFQYVEDNGNLIGLNSFCRSHKLIYKKCKRYIDALNVNQISSDELYDLKEHNYETVC